MVMNLDWSKPSTSGFLRPAHHAHTTLRFQDLVCTANKGRVEGGSQQAASGPRPPAFRYDILDLHYQVGNCIPLADICQGAKLARAAGTFAKIMKEPAPQCLVRLPSGVEKLIDSRCRATIGIVSNPNHGARKLRKAGQSRWLGRRPIVRGVAMNPVDHPHGGGEGRTKGGRPSVSPWGKPTKAGFRTVGARPVLLSQTRTTLNVREDKGRPPERTDRRNITYPNRTTRLTFGFRLGRCIILHFPKRTFIHFFLPRRPRRLKRRDKSRPRKDFGRWWAFGKVGPIGCLHSSDGTEEERKESSRLDDREKQNERRIWPKRRQRYGYHDRSPSRQNNLSKSLRISGAFKHPKDAGVVNDIAFLIENDDSFIKTKLFKFFFPKKSRSDGPTSNLLIRTLPAVCPSLNYFVMQYFLKKKNKMHFDPVVVLNHFVAPGVAEPSTMGGANEQGGSVDKRIRSRIGFFVESSTSDQKSLAEAKKRLTHFIRQANDLRFADGVGVSNNLIEDAREQLLGQLRSKFRNLMDKEKVMKLIEKFIDLGRIGELRKGIEMMIEIILRNRRIPYGYNSYLNEEDGPQKCLCVHGTRGSHSSAVVLRPHFHRIPPHDR
ncbi:unnamed protein product [Victoria cruziana]